MLNVVRVGEKEKEKLKNRNVLSTPNVVTEIAERENRLLKYVAGVFVNLK